MEDHKFAKILYTFAAKRKRSREKPKKRRQDKLEAIPADEQSYKCHRCYWGIF
jgi:hypothetical protein